MNKPPLLINNIVAQRTRAEKLFDECLDFSNKIWHGMLRLVITLSSSGLVLTIALVGKLFPAVRSIAELPLLLILSWILFFISIIFGIIAGVSESIFFSNLAHEHSETIKECNKKISKGILFDAFIEDEQTEYIVNSNVAWGAISINSFIVAIIFMCIALLERDIAGAKWYMIIISLSLLIILNLYLIKKRYQN
jgi:hypothetical protein